MKFHISPLFISTAPQAASRRQTAATLSSCCSSPLTPFSLSFTRKSCPLYIPRIQSLSPSHRHCLGRNHCHSLIRSLQQPPKWSVCPPLLPCSQPFIQHRRQGDTTTVSQTMSRLLFTCLISLSTTPSPLLNSRNNAFLAHARHMPAQDLCTGCLCASTFSNQIIP